ncbi:MAG: ACP S-malonyltransferase [Polyangiaceae bacterium]|nr:ACP S-malonyltransferase [Polyangiaceae bacterium]
MKPILMFPGQSSRHPEMMDQLFARWPELAAPVFEEASAALGRDLRAHYDARNQEMFACNRDVQVGVFLANHVHLLALDRAGVRAELSLGLSLGEYNHLVHAGALELADAVRLVDERGAVYDEGPEGAMASVFPLALEELAEVVERARESGPLEVSNLNSPTQHVLSGARAAIDAAAAILDAEHGCECRIIEQRIPMHASIFRPAADALRPALERAPWREPRLPYLPNVLGRFEEQPTPERIVDLLFQHVFSPVRWRESIELLADLHPDAVFVEVGPRAVLYNLLGRKWRPVQRLRTDTLEERSSAFNAAAMELSDVA